MNFKVKAYLQKTFSALPNGEKINFLFQKYITRSLPISDRDFIGKMESVKSHFDNYLKHSANKDVKESSYFEFGTGYDMAIPLAISLLGFKELTCIDIRALVFPELVNDTIVRFNKLKKEIPFSFEMPGPIPVVTHSNLKNVLKEKFRINYLAPMDARATSLKTGSIDFILSNATFEHIPEADVETIFKECFRILKNEGVMSNAIDYRDHWSFFDSSISCYNFLKYSGEYWKKINPSIMYQNRMRHKDYIEKIRNSGFEILEESTTDGNPDELRILDNLKLDSYFCRNYNKDELSLKSSVLVLSK